MIKRFSMVLAALALLVLSSCGVSNLGASGGDSGGSADSSVAADVGSSQDSTPSVDVQVAQPDVSCGNCNPIPQCNANELGKPCVGLYGVCAVGNGVTECKNGVVLCSTALGGSKCSAKASEDCGNGNGNGLDDNCNGAVDEGCAVAPQAKGNGKLTAEYPSAFKRTLTAQVTRFKSELGSYWNNTSQPSYGTSVSETFTFDASAPCTYVLWNVIDTNPATPYHTACIGNGLSAKMYNEVVPSMVANNVYYDSQDLIAWSKPGGAEEGCAGLFIVVAPGTNPASCGF